MLDQTIYLDVVPGGLPAVVNVSQFDEGSRTLHINLYASVGEFEIPAGSTAKVQGTKRDKKGFSYSAILSGTEVTCDITQNMTAISGRVYCEVVIENENNVLVSATFILAVKKAAFQIQIFRIFMNWLRRLLRMRKTLRMRPRWRDRLLRRLHNSHLKVINRCSLT